MTRLITIISLLFPAWLVGQRLLLTGAGQGATVVSNNLGPVDSYIDMNTSSNGTTLTTTIMGNGTLGNANMNGWALSVSPITGFTVSAGATDLGSAVSVNGTSYATNHTHKSFSLDHAQTAPRYVQGSFFPGYRKVTVAGWITFGPASVAAGSAVLFDYFIVHAANGSYATVQLNNGNCGVGAVYGINIETNPSGTTTHSTCVTLTSGSTYWVSLNADWVSGTATMDVYNTAFARVGSSTTVSQSTGSDLSTLRIGNNETGTSSGNTSVFENFVVAFSGQSVKPIGPTNSTMPSVYLVSKAAANASGGATTLASAATDLKAGNLSLAFISSETSGSTISSVADTAGNTYTSDATCKVSLSGQAQIEAWWAKNTTANASNVVTATYSGSSVFRTIQVLQIAGANTTSPFDVCATGTVASGNATVTTGSFTPSTATGTNYIGGHITSGTVMTSGTNYDGIYSSTNSYSTSSRIAAPNSSQTASLTSSSTASKVAVVINLKQ